MTLTAERLREILAYDPETGVFTWQVRPARCINIGDVAGCIHGSGYRDIRIAGRPYRAHRLAWLWMTGKWPTADLDHKNVDPSDNRWNNLREATESQNGANRRMPANNKSGFKGVYWNKGALKWVAHIKVNGEQIYLGHFDTPEAAHSAYASAAEKYFGEFSRAA